MVKEDAVSCVGLGDFVDVVDELEMVVLSLFDQLEEEIEVGE